jgi:hypothetical protein
MKYTAYTVNYAAFLKKLQLISLLPKSIKIILRVVFTCRHGSFKG